MLTMSATALLCGTGGRERDTLRSAETSNHNLTNPALAWHSWGAQLCLSGDSYRAMRIALSEGPRIPLYGRLLAIILLSVVEHTTPSAGSDSERHQPPPRGDISSLAHPCRSNYIHEARHAFHQLATDRCHGSWRNGVCVRSEQFSQSAPMKADQSCRSHEACHDCLTHCQTRTVVPGVDAKRKGRVSACRFKVNSESHWWVSGADRPVNYTASDHRSRA